MWFPLRATVQWQSCEQQPPQLCSAQPMQLYVTALLLETGIPCLIITAASFGFLLGCYVFRSPKEAEQLMIMHVVEDSFFQCGSHNPEVKMPPNSCPAFPLWRQRTWSFYKNNFSLPFSFLPSHPTNIYCSAKLRAHKDVGLGLRADKGGRITAGCTGIFAGNQDKLRANRFQ